MAKEFSHGPNGTLVAGVTALEFPLAPLNYDVDFHAVSRAVGDVTYSDITSPSDQPATIRFSQQGKADIYAGTGIDSSMYLPTRKGTTTRIEVREVWSLNDTTDATYQKLAPATFTMALSLPTHASVSVDDVRAIVARGIAALYSQGEGTMDTGVNLLLHGVVEKD